MTRSEKRLNLHLPHGRMPLLLRAEAATGERGRRAASVQHLGKSAGSISRVRGMRGVLLARKEVAV